MKPITLADYLMGRDKQFPIDDDQRTNALHLLSRVNEMLEAFYKVFPRGEVRKVTSGYRPAAINTAVGGAKKSNHMKCTAVDLSDGDGALDKWLFENQDILEKFDLYLEHPASTKGANGGGGWTHVQTTPTMHRVFRP